MGSLQSGYFCPPLLRNRIQYFTSSRVKELHAEEIGAFAEGLYLTGAIDQMVPNDAGVEAGQTSTDSAYGWREIKEQTTPAPEIQIIVEAKTRRRARTHDR